MSGIVGIDYGRKRVGFAVGDEATMLALPHATVNVGSMDEAIAASCRVATERKAKRFVVGIPLNMDGTGGDMAREVRDFAQRLAVASSLPVDCWDERLSSGLVDRMLVEADLSRDRRKQVRDKLAAQVILQGYLDARSLSAGNGGDEQADR